MDAAALVMECLDLLRHSSIAATPELFRSALECLCRRTGVRTVKLRGAQISVAHSLELAADHALELVQALGAHHCALHDVAGVVAGVELPDLLVRLPPLCLEHRSGV